MTTAGEALEKRLTAAVGSLNLATAAVVELLAEALATDAWAVEGIRSREHWVMWQCGVSRRRAEGLVALASRRDELPATTKRFDAGELSEDHAALIAQRVPTSRDEVTAEQAPRLTYPQLARAVRHMPPIARPDEAPTQPRREFSFGHDGERFRGRFSLPPDEGALLEQALRRKRDELFAAAGGDDLAARRITWADALVKLASDALGAPTPNTDSGRDRYVVNFFVDADQEGAPTWLHLGPLVDPEVRRRHTCDGVVRAFLREHGRVVAKGRRRRVVDPVLRALIEERDGGCRHPLCTATKWVDVHHLQHWEDGGSTDPSNLCVLCRHHHRAHHRGEFTIEGNPEEPNGLVFRARAGWIIRPPERDHPPKPPPTAPNGWQHPWGGPIYNVGLHWTA